MTESRSIDLSVEVPGSPEEVWETIATGPGIGSWFIPMEVEERPGGTVTMDFGAFGKHSAEVRDWEPPKRVVFVGEGERPLAYEWLVEARDGGTCVVRLVNSGFDPSAEFDAEFEGMEMGWRIFLQSLRLQLAHFRGRRARAAIPTVTLPGPNAAAWSALCEAIGVPPDLGPGDRLRTSGDAPVLGGTVESVLRMPKVTAYLLLVDEPSPGTAFVAAEGNGDEVASSVYLYLYDDAPDEWTPWMTARFEPLEAPLTG